MVSFLLSWTSYAQKDSLSFLALGDSYTIGTSEIPEYAWPIQLQKILTKKGISLKEPKIIAGAGWPSKKLIEELDSFVPENTYDFVSLLIGINNQYRNQSLNEFKEDLTTLLDRSIDLANNDKSNVFVLSIPDWSKTPFAQFKDKEKIAEELKEFNDILFTDITKISKKVLFDKSLIAKDNLHPSRKMYKSWVRKISRELTKKL